MRHSCPWPGKRRKVVACVEWYHMHPSRDPRFWHEVGTERIKRRIRKHDYLPKSVQIVDASFRAASRRSNTDVEKAAIKAGKSAADIWPDKPAKAVQKRQGTHESRQIYLTKDR